MDSKNILVTGGCGFIGKALVARLVQRGHTVRILDNLSVGRPEDLGDLLKDSHQTSNGSAPNWMPGSVGIMVGDICDDATCLEACAGAEAIAHLAANPGVPKSIKQPDVDFHANALGTFNMLEAARKIGVPRFVFASSSAPLGEVTPPIHEEIVAHPTSPYGASKLAGEAYCNVYNEAYGMDTVALRFGNVYGPGSGHKTSVVAAFVNAALQDGQLTVFGDGSQTRDFIFLGDLLDAIMAALECDNIGGQVFQIATSRETTVNEIAELVSDALVQRGIQRPRIHRANKRPGDVQRNYSDTSKAERLLGWKARKTVTEGISITVNSLINEKKKS